MLNWLRKQPILNRYGWRRDNPDCRDKRCFMHQKLTAPLPPKHTMKGKFREPFNQGDLGSCVANSVSNLMWWELCKDPNWKSPGVKPSRLFIYYNGRVIENTVSSDSGLSIRDGIKAVVANGVCNSPQWPYVIQNFTKRPPQRCYDAAAKFKPIEYRSVSQGLDEIKACLASDQPVAFGITVYESFEGHTPSVTGVIPLPSPNEECLGGHAILLVGYDDMARKFTFLNSWGSHWGDQGYGYLPYDYVLNPTLASDFWMVQTVS